MSRHFVLPLLVAGLLVAVALSLQTEAVELAEGTTVLAAAEGLRWQRGLGRSACTAGRRCLGRQGFHGSHGVGFFLVGTGVVCL